MIVKRLGIAAALFASACANDPVSVSKTNNTEMQIELLFEHDGCKVYRFEDYGRSHYYARCRCEAAATIGTHSEPCGKNCTHTVDENIPTETR